MRKISILLCSLLFTYAHSEEKLPVIKIFKEGDLPPVLIHGERPEVVENKNVTPTPVTEIKKVEKSVAVEKIKPTPVIEHKKVIVHHKHKHIIVPVKKQVAEPIHEEKLIPIEEKHEPVVYTLKSMDTFGEFQLPKKTVVVYKSNDDNAQLIQKIKWAAIGFSIFTLLLLSLKRTKIIKPEWFFYVSRNNLKALKRKKELEGLL
jgi:hypothetical protein